MKVSTKKMFSIALSLFNIGFVSNFSISALPGGCLIYFAGKERVTDNKINVNSLYNKNCCKCGKNLADRCGQFTCAKGCATCGSQNCYFKDKKDIFDKILGEGCEHKKGAIFEKTKSDGCFCFIKREDSKTPAQSLEYARNNDELYCAYCMRNYLVANYGIFDTNLNQLPNNSNYVCVICLEKIESESLNRCKECNRWFHSFCLSQWRSIKDSCPWCKKPGVKNSWVFVPKNMSDTPENDFILSSACCETESCTDCSEEDEYMQNFSSQNNSFDSINFLD